MSQMVDGPRKCFTAGEAIAAGLRVYISAATGAYGPTVSIAGVSAPSIGVVEDYTASGAPCTVLLANASGTRKMVASEGITINGNVFAAASGKVASTGTILEGKAFETVTANNDVIEVMSTFGEDVDEDWTDDELLEMGTGDDAVLLWSTGDADNHSLVLGLGDSNQALHITDKGARATDWNVAADTHPTIYVHSNTTPATDYVKIGAHTGTGVWLGDMVGTALGYIGFDGLEVLQFNETASAVNHIGVTNAATGDFPKVVCEGEADTGIIFCNSEGEEILILDSIATSVNEITIKSAATGNFPQICATGEADTGITFMNDQSEEILILDSVASSVNEITIKSAATGQNAEIQASGETNVGISIKSKGTGTVDLFYATTEIASVQATGLAIGAYVVAGTDAGTDQLTMKSTGTAPTGTGANVGHLYCDYETDDDELFFLSGTGGTATQLTT